MSKDPKKIAGNDIVRFETLAWPSATEQYGEQWASVIHQKGLNPSLHPRWVNAIASSIELNEEIRVLVSLENNTFTGAIPYLTSKRLFLGISVTHLEFASNLVSYHAEVVTRSDPEKIVGELLEHHRNWHVLHAANLRLDGPTASAIHTISKRIGGQLHIYPVDSSPFLPIEGDWETFLASKNKKFRYKYRQRRKILEGNPDHMMRWFNQPADVELLLNDILQIESHSWKANSQVDISRNSPEKQYYEMLLPFLAEHDALLANVFYVGASPIAYNLCCNWHGWVGQLKTSFHEDFKHLSPGSIVIDAAIEAAFNAGANEFDFLGHADRHKLSWTTHTREHADFFLHGPAYRSRLLGYSKKFKKQLQHAVSRLIAGLRSAAT